MDAEIRETTTEVRQFEAVEAYVNACREAARAALMHWKNPTQGTADIWKHWHQEIEPAWTALPWGPMPAK